MAYIIAEPCARKQAQTPHVSVIGRRAGSLSRG